MESVKQRQEEMFLNFSVLYIKKDENKLLSNRILYEKLRLFLFKKKFPQYIWPTKKAVTMMMNELDYKQIRKSNERYWEGICIDDEIVQEKENQQLTDELSIIKNQNNRYMMITKQRYVDNNSSAQIRMSVLKSNDGILKAFTFYIKLNG